jgi:hypothetical protein
MQILYRPFNIWETIVLSLQQVDPIIENVIMFLINRKQEFMPSWWTGKKILKLNQSSPNIAFENYDQNLMRTCLFFL